MSSKTVSRSTRSTAPSTSMRWPLSEMLDRERRLDLQLGCAEERAWPVLLPLGGGCAAVPNSAAKLTRDIPSASFLFTTSSGSGLSLALPERGQLLYRSRRPHSTPYGDHEVTARSASLCLALLAASGCDRSDTPGDASRSVTVYVSTDRVFSEPVLQEYQRRSGVTVNTVYDTEETKSTGLANRLLAETASTAGGRVLVERARTDAGAEVPWRARPLSFAERGRHSGRASRWGRLLDRFLGAPACDCLQHEARGGGSGAAIGVGLADPKWRGQVAIADPRFGSTSFHVAALYAVMGDEKRTTSSVASTPTREGCRRQLRCSRHGGSRRSKSRTHRYGRRERGARSRPADWHGAARSGRNGRAGHAEHGVADPRGAPGCGRAEVH